MNAESVGGRNYPTGVRLRVFQAAVLSLSLMLASVAVVACLLGDMAKEFSDAPRWLLQSFVTFPVVGGIIANLIGGVTAVKLGKKNLCLLGIALAFIGGFFPMFIPSLIGKIVCRVLAGLGVGLIQPLSASLIVDCFEGKTANVMMGFQSSCVGLGASLFSYTMAAIMVYDWHFAYFAYLYAVAIFLLVLFGIPAFVNDIGREKKNGGSASSAGGTSTGNKAASVAVASNGAKSKLPASCYVGCAAQLFYSLGYGALAVSLSLAAVETGVISTVQAAAISSWGGLASLFGGLIFGFMKNKIGMKVGPLALSMNAIGLIIIGMTGTVPMWYVGITILQVGFCWWMPFVNFLVNDGTDESNSALATALGFVGNSVGSFVCAYVLAFAGSILGGISSHNAFFYGAVWIVITLVIVLVYQITSAKKAAGAR